MEIQPKLKLTFLYFNDCPYLCDPISYVLCTCFYFFFLFFSWTFFVTFFFSSFQFSLNFETWIFAVPGARVPVSCHVAIQFLKEIPYIRVRYSLHTYGNSLFLLYLFSDNTCANRLFFIFFFFFYNFYKLLKKSLSFIFSVKDHQR